VADDKLISALIGAGVASVRWIVTSLQQQIVKSRDERKAFLKRQVEEFYDPLLALVQKKIHVQACRSAPGSMPSTGERRRMSRSSLWRTSSPASRGRCSRAVNPIVPCCRYRSRDASPHTHPGLRRHRALTDRINRLTARLQSDETNGGDTPEQLFWTRLARLPVMARNGRFIDRPDTLSQARDLSRGVACRTGADHTFFLNASTRICLSSVRSATTRFSRAFRPRATAASAAR